MRLRTRRTQAAKGHPDRPSPSRWQIARIAGPVVALIAVVAAVCVALVVPAWRELLVGFALVGFLAIAAALQR